MAIPFQTVLMAGPRFDEVGPDGVRRIGTRAGQPAMRKGQLIAAAPEQVIWTIRPDGSATLSRRLIPYQPEMLAGSRNWSQYRGPSEAGMVIAPPDNQGGPFATYNFSPDGLRTFRMAASLFPDGVVERGISVNGTPWPAWDFPFTAEDAARMRQWVVSLSPADAFAIYYNLLAFDGVESSGCRLRRFNPAISPAEFESNYFWPVFQDMVAMTIYNIRTDLHKVRDPETGKTIDGLIKYDLFAMPCKAGIGEIIFGVIASVALGVVTAGAGAALSTAIRTIDLAKTIHDMKSDAAKAKAVEAFTNSVVKGYSAGTDIQNILQPPPKLTPAEEVLVAKAEGKMPPASQPSPEQKPSQPGAGAQGGAIPLLVLAAAGAAMLLS